RDFDLVTLAILLDVVVFAGVNIGMGDPRFEPDKFHDIDFAASGPTGLAIGAESPNARPGASGGRQFGANLDSSIGPSGFPARGQAGRCVFGKFAAAPTASFIRGRGVERWVLEPFFVGFDD